MKKEMLQDKEFNQKNGTHVWNKTNDLKLLLQGSKHRLHLLSIPMLYNNYKASITLLLKADPIDRSIYLSRENIQGL